MWPIFCFVNSYHKYIDNITNIFQHDDKTHPPSYERADFLLSGNNEATVFLVSCVCCGDDELMVLNGFLEEFFAGGV